MTLRRAHLIAGAGVVALVFCVYWAKTKAQAAQDRVAALRAQIAEDRRAIRTLRAELAFLESPARVEAAARDALGLAPVSSDRRITLAELPARLPPVPAAPPSPEPAP